MLASGIIVPASLMSGAKPATTTHFRDVRDEANQLEALYGSAAIALQTGSSIARYIASARLTYERWFAGSVRDITQQMLAETISLHRLCQAALGLQAHPKLGHYLERLLDGPLDLSIRATASPAKNALHELEIWSRLRQNGISAILEEPDVTYEDASGKTGLACKKLYSEGHVQNVLSEAVSQLEATTGFGLVVIDLDELFLDQLAPGNALKVDVRERSAGILDEFGFAFLRRHERHFLKYFSSNRISAAMVSITCVVHVVNPRDGVEEPLFIATRWPTWTHPGLPDADKARVRTLARILCGEEVPSGDFPE